MKFLQRFRKTLIPALCLHDWQGSGSCVVEGRVSALRYCDRCKTYERLVTSPIGMDWVAVEDKHLPRPTFEVAKGFMTFMQSAADPIRLVVYIGNAPEIQIAEWFADFRKKLQLLADQDSKNIYQFEVQGPSDFAGDQLPRQLIIRRKPKYDRHGSKGQSDYQVSGCIA